MIGAKSKAPATLADAIAALDFSAGNAELEKLRAELAHVTAKEGETRTEALRLADEARNYTGPQSDAVAAAILAGKSLSEATKGSTSREELEVQRDALRSALEPLRQRIDDLRKEIAEAEQRERAKVLEALGEYVEGLAQRQTQAAQDLVETYAAMTAIADATGQPYIPGLSASKLAVKGVLGGDHLLGWRTSLPVPAEVREALDMLASKSSAVRSSPGEISTRYL